MYASQHVAAGFKKLSSVLTMDTSVYTVKQVSSLGKIFTKGWCVILVHGTKKQGKKVGMRVRTVQYITPLYIPSHIKDM